MDVTMPRGLEEKIVLPIRKKFADHDRARAEEYIEKLKTGKEYKKVEFFVHEVPLYGELEARIEIVVLEKKAEKDLAEERGFKKHGA